VSITITPLVFREEEEKRKAEKQKSRKGEKEKREEKKKRRREEEEEEEGRCDDDRYTEENVHFSVHSISFLPLLSLPSAQLSFSSSPSLLLVRLNRVNFTIKAFLFNLF